ncbi:uncharacterized protein LOC111339637 isoform X2 [Stylophora pistillata]|nr:uncharacterized protein LOC111339637 isoform X2 [Stylophora pistillata]
MACRRQILCCLVFIALLPALVSCIRPFRAPRNLFKQGTSSLTLPEGVRIIRRQASDELFVETSHDLEEQHIRSRFRRDSPPGIDTTNQPLGSYDEMYMYWPESKKQEHFVFLLAKKPKPPGKTSNPVYVSTNYGRNFTKAEFTNANNLTAVIDQIYFSKVEPTLAIFADVANKVLHRTDDLQTFKNYKISWVPSYITFHPWNSNYVMGYDNTTEKLYVSSNKGKSFAEREGDVKSFNWGVENIDLPDVIFVEKFQKSLQERITGNTKDNRTKVIKMYIESKKEPINIATDVDEFEMMKNYQFYTTKLRPKDKHSVLKVSKKRGFFKVAKFPTNEESRDFFVFDVVEDQVFVVINHLRNLSNMYQSDSSGVKYQLSLPRVLYHNPYTDVSSAWLRTVVPYAFVDVDRIKSVRGVYVATQLTPGPVGRRHLLSLITYNNGGRWQRIRSPTVDNRGVKINCYLPGCSIHVNLLYGAVYRVSPSERLLSSKSAPGLVLALGVASTNLKIYPDLFVSSDGGVIWNRALRGKYLFTYGDHGGVIVAVPYRRYTRSLKYSTDGGFSWSTYVFSPKVAILARDIVTQPGERLPVFLVLGSRFSRNRVQSWTVFYLNMTNIMGPVCDSSGFSTFKDGCILGRQQEFETRNWTIHCHMGRDYNRPQNIGNCPCSRDDFTCDYGFQRKNQNFDEECTPIKSDDLNKELIPNDCPEGSFYNRSQGFRKIEGNTCENGTEEDFLPVQTHCPVQELKNFTLSSPNVTDDGKVAVETGSTVFFNTSFVKGYQKNVNYMWYYGDEHEENGFGVQFASRNHSYHKAGRYHVIVVAHNERSTLVQKMEVYVQDKLVSKRVSTYFHPKNPGVDEDVMFSINLNYSAGDVGKVMYKWQYDDVSGISSWQQVVTLRFKKAQNYTVEVTAKNFVSFVKKKVQIKVINKDSVPQNVTASVLGPTKINITWKHAGKTGSYRHNVYMSTSGNTGFNKIKCANETPLSCTVEKLLPATTYYVKVSSLSGGKESLVSNIAFTTTNTSAPGAPRDLRAYPVNSSAIRVEWKAPEYPNKLITSYTIRYWPFTNDKVEVIQNVLNSSKIITGLAQDTVYFFEVSANSGSDRSLAAGPKQALTKLSKPVLPPQNIEMISNNGTCAVVRWSPPNISASDQRPFPAKGYKVELVGKQPIDVGSSYVVICHLSPGVKSKISIWAYSEAGEGPKAAVNITTQITKPGAPRNFKAVAISPNRIKLTWVKPSQSGGIVTGYIINQLSPHPDTKPIEVDPNQSSYIVRGLEAYVTYKFVISAKNQRGSSVKSPPASATTNEDSPGIVEYVTTETIPPTSASIKVTWSKPSKPRGKITHYKISWGKTFADQEDISSHQVDGGQMAYTVKHLSNNTYYSFTVIAVNSGREGLQHISPKKQRTDTAIDGTERLKLNIEGPKMSDKGRRDSFIQQFYKKASEIANIADDRIADVVVTERGAETAVYFDLIPPINESDVQVETAKNSINTGFKIEERIVVKGSLSLVSKARKTQSRGEPTVSARKGGQPEAAQSKASLAVLIPLVIIGLILAAGLVFFFVKYKNLQKNFSKLHEKEHEEDEMTVYHEDMQADSPDVIFSDRSRRGKKFYKDSEKVPLGDHDELSMI